MGEMYWKDQDSFSVLCDMVAKGNMVCLTGAGVSKGLKNRDDKGLPDWQELLERIYHVMEGYITNDSDKAIIQELISTEDRDTLMDLKDVLNKLLVNDREHGLEQEDIKTIRSVLDQKLLSGLSAGAGERLIAVASLLRKANPKLFNKTLLDIVTWEGDDPTETHKAIAELNPRGIMTYNYDTGHEKAWKKQGVKFDLLVPSMKEKIRTRLENDSEKKYILKAHGSTGDKDSLVLTSESYSDLFTKYSHYKTLVQDILMNHQLLIVGFGMSDPDFDRMIQDLFTTFGGPIQKHVVITHKDSRSRRDTLYEHNYGFHYLYVNDFPDIPVILRNAAVSRGPYVNDLLKEIVTPGRSKKAIHARSEAHRKLRSLNDVAKQNVALYLEDEIRKDLSLITRISKEDPKKALRFEAQEYVYSYGCLLDKDPGGDRKNFLINDVILKCHDPKVLCHALYQIKDYLDKKDLWQISEWRRMFEDPKYFTDYGFRDGELKADGTGKPGLRNAVYCRFLEAMVRSKFYVFDKD